VLKAVEVCIEAGAPGITVHPRADRRHITPDDVRQIARVLKEDHPEIEYNIEGDPRPDLLELVDEVRPTQCTLVPVAPGEITSQAGWQPGRASELPRVVERLHAIGTRVSLFVDARSEPILWAAAIGADRVELYTEPFARAFERGLKSGGRPFLTCVEAAEIAHGAGLGVNAGHDLNLENLVVFRALPHLEEVSIGHAIASRALFVGLRTVVLEYLAVLKAGTNDSAPMRA
jgi:pyridoxine 5-phosphate synthase